MKARSREGPLAPRGGEGLGRRRLGPGGECRARASGFPGTQTLFPSSALPALQVHPPPPFRPPRWKPPSGPSSVPGGFERGLSEVFQAAPPRPAFTGHTLPPIPPPPLQLQHRVWGVGKGAGRRRLRGRSTTSGARLGLERLEIRSPCRPRRKRRHSAPAPHQPEGEGVGGEGRGGGEEERAGGGGGHVHITRVPVPGASQGTI